MRPTVSKKYALCAALVAAVTLAEAPPAKFYNDPSAYRLMVNQAELEVLMMVNEIRAERGLEKWTYDTALSMVAREHSADMAANDYFDYHSPRLGSLEYRLRRAGVSVVGSRFAIFQVANISRLRPMLMKEAVPFPLCEGTHLGVGVETGGFPRNYYVTLVASKRLTVLDPFPTTASPGAKFKLSGRLDPSLSNARVAMTVPDGTVLELEATALPGGRFSAEIAFAQGKGQYMVEVLATSKFGSVVTDLMPVYVGVPYPPPDLPIASGQTSDDLGQAAKEMLALLNRERAAYGLKPLRWDDELAAVALGHSQDMVRNGFFAHVSPTVGDLDSRMAKAGIKRKLFSENIAQNRTLYEAHLGLMQSPGHRKNILDPEADSVGIGIVRHPDGQLYVTQNFGHDFEELDTARIGAELLEGINQERRRLGRPPLREERQFSEIALENSRHMQENDKLSVDKAKELLDAKKLQFKFCQMAVHVSAFPPKPEHLQKVFEERYTLVGIGIVQGDSRARGPKHLWTTVLLIEK